MIPAQFEQLATDALVVTRLRERATAGLIEPYFESHRMDFASARIARLIVPTETEAIAIATQLREGSLDFLAAAEPVFLRQPADDPSRGDLFATIQAGATPEPLAAAVFSALPGAIVGPAAVENGYAVVRVLTVEPARLDSTTRQAIQTLLFDRWLDARRTTGSVEWYWGSAQSTE